MIKFNIFVLFAVVCCLTYINASRSWVGKEEKDQVLLWAEHKQSPIYPEQQNVTHAFAFDGSDRNVERITLIAFDYEMDSVYTVFSLDSGGPSFNSVQLSYGCQYCTFLSVTERIYGFYKKKAL